MNAPAPAHRPRGVSRDDPSVQISYKAQGKTLREFHDTDAFLKTLIGPLGSGKTQACVMEVLHHIHTQEPDGYGVRRSRVAIVRNTQPDLAVSTIPDFLAIVTRMEVGTFTDGAPPRWRCRYRREDGTQVDGDVIFRSFDKAGDERRARGMQLSGCWLNELKELSKANVDLVLSRVGRYPPKSDTLRDAQGRMIPFKRLRIADSNAPDRDEWLGRMALETRPDGWWFGIQPPAVRRVGGKWLTNPGAENLHNLYDGYYTEQAAGKAETWIRKNLANEFVFHTDHRPIHPDFSDALHVRPCEATPGLPLQVGIDFGRTPAAIVCQRQVNGQWYVLSELCTVNMGADRFGQLLHQHMNEHYPNYSAEFTGDPAGDDMAQTRDETPFDLLAIHGVEAYPAPTNDPLERYAALDTLLRGIVDREPQIVFDPRCKMLVRGLAGAYYFRRVQVVGEERYRDKAEKTPESHVCEALHYALLGAGEGRAMYDTAFERDYGDVESWAPPTEYFE